MTDKLRHERRKLEDFLRKLLLDLEEHGKEEDGLALLRAVREFIIGECQDTLLDE